MTHPDNIPADVAKLIRERHARLTYQERARDARLLAAYEAECLASWAKRDGVKA
jgi:hypothetical protein